MRAPSFRAFCERVGKNILSSYSRFVQESASTPGQVSGHEFSALPDATEGSKGCVVVPTKLEQIPFLAAQPRAQLLPANCSWFAGTKCSEARA